MDNGTIVYLWLFKKDFIYLAYFKYSKTIQKIAEISNLIEKRTLQIEIENNNGNNQKIKIKNIYFVPDIEIGLINPAQ